MYLTITDLDYVCGLDTTCEALEVPPKTISSLLLFMSTDENSVGFESPPIILGSIGFVKHRS